MKKIVTMIVAAMMALSFSMVAVAGAVVTGCRPGRVKVALVWYSF